MRRPKEHIKMKSFSSIIPVLLGLAVTACSSDTSDANEDSTGGGAGSSGGGDAGSSGNGDAGTGGEEGSDSGLENISNIPVDEIDFEGLGGLSFTGDVVIDTSRGTIGGTTADESGFQYFTVDQEGGGPTLAVFVLTNMKIQASSVVQVVGALPLVLVVQQDMDIFGQLVVAVDNEDAAAGGFSCTPSGEGAGPGGGAATTGGGGSFCGIGGDGGGSPYGGPELVPLIAGSSGGSQGDRASGGAGGGAIQLVAGIQITIGMGATVSVGGGGAAYDDGWAGGGSGGAILLEAPSVTMAGTLAANGGAGNEGCRTGGCDDATNGLGSGRAAEGVEGAGSGSAADLVDGEPGDGGGGGAGRIRINSDPDQTTITGVISPSIETECFSQGTLG
jgi:hypothetical protein